MNKAADQFAGTNYVAVNNGGHVNVFPRGSAEHKAAVDGQCARGPRQKKLFKAFIPAQVVSEANRSDALKKKLKRKKEQKLAVARAFDFELMNRGVPKSVTLVLLTDKPQDEHDNLRTSFKRIVDQIAAMCGFNDREKVWKYRQEKLRSFEQRGCWVCIQF